MRIVEQEKGRKHQAVEPAHWVLTVDRFDNRRFNDFEDFCNDLKSAMAALPLKSPDSSIKFTIYYVSPKTTGLIEATMGHDPSTRAPLASTVEALLMKQIASRLRVGTRYPGAATLAGLDTGVTWDITRRDEDSRWKQLSP